MSLNNFGIVKSIGGKTLSRSAQPDAEGIFTLEKLGVQIILKLNSSSEYPLTEEKKVSVAIGFAECPLDPFNPDEKIVRQLALDIQSYLTANTPGMSVHIHCSHGRDRTGLIIGAWQLLYGGISLNDVLAQRKAYGTSWLGDFTADHEIVEMLKKFSQEKGLN
jgi:hypothetical protein